MKIENCQKKSFSIFINTSFFPFYKITLFSFFFLSYSCDSEKIEIQPAFYHWQTNLSLSELEKRYLSDLSIQKIYPKFFDVDWDFNRQEATALATMSLSTNLPKTLEIVPTVFITNRSLVQISADQITDLANKIAQKLQGQMTAFSDQSIKEIQIDCDWTQSTQAKYFDLLKILNKIFNPQGINLSVTIRLHQIKYAEKTGVPPVNRGMLMYYNMGEVQKGTTNNSILDNVIGAKYLDKLAAYPLPLDIALPLFQWGVLFRNDKMIKLLNQLTAQDLSDGQRFAKVDKNHWEVIKSTYLNGVYLYKNDRIRLEKVEISALKTATALLQKQLKIADRSIVFYHLDSTVIRQFEIAELKEIIQKFEKDTK
ncbi:MAG: hypothetical protein AB8G86_08275 [Saprospiraceae bacterium]